jgi:hypothetical protein
LIRQVEVLIVTSMWLFQRKRLGLSILGLAMASLVMALSSCGKPERHNGDREKLEKKDMINVSEAVKTETATFALG